MPLFLANTGLGLFLLLLLFLFYFVVVIFICLFWAANWRVTNWENRVRRIEHKSEKEGRGRLPAKTASGERKAIQEEEWKDAEENNDRKDNMVEDKSESV